MLYAPLAVERLVAAVFVLPAYAAKPTRRERVSRRGPSGAGERAARALTQERAQRTLRRLPAGRTAAASGRPGERPPSCVHPRGRPGHGKPSTVVRSAAHSPAVKDHSYNHGAQRLARGGGARCPRVACAVSQSVVAILLEHAARPGLDIGALRHYIPNPCKEGGATVKASGRSGTAPSIQERRDWQIPLGRGKGVTGTRGTGTAQRRRCLPGEPLGGR
jgi:hypothetical protein